MLIIGKNGRLRKPYLSKRLREWGIAWSLERIVNKYSCYTPNECIVAEISKRVDKCTAPITAAEKQQCIEYSIWHHENNKRYFDNIDKGVF